MTGHAILTVRRRLWRWLRFPLAIVAAVFAGILIWMGWLLSGQRYQHLLTQELSTLLGAEVRVAGSRLSLRRGLGIQFETVAVQSGADASPFFTAKRIDMFIDLSALLHGQLLFRRIDCVRPRMRLEGGAGGQGPLPGGLLAAPGTTAPADGWFAAVWSPTLALQAVSLADGEIVYVREPHGSPLVLTHTDATLTYTTGDGVTVKMNAALGQNGEAGQIALWAATPYWEAQQEVQLIEWHGEVDLHNLVVQQVGRMLGAEWPRMTLDLGGQYHGKWAGPVELAGEVEIGALQISGMRVDTGKATLTKVFWPGPADKPLALSSLLHAAVIEARLEEVRGEIEKSGLPVTLHKGDFTLRNEELVASGIAGTYGTKSQITDAAGTLKHLFASRGPVLDARLVADLDLEEGVGRFLASPAGAAALVSVAQHLTQPRGRALVRVGLQASGLPGALSYEGEVVLQQAGFRLSTWNVEVSDVSGSVRLDKETLVSDALTLKVGESWLQVQGSVRGYRAPQRSADLRLAFTAARDYDLAPFLPSGMLLPQGGALSGQVGVTFPTQGGPVQTEGKVALSRIRLAPLSFLQPLEVVDGEVAWQGQSGTFAVTQGRLPGGEFSGRGRLCSFTPLNIEVAVEFNDLNLEQALALDKPQVEDGSPKDTTVVVRADLTCGRLTYKTMQAEDLRLSCHWSGRQADLYLAETKAAGGKIQGEAVLWPDNAALFLAPHLTNVDLPNFLKAVGTPTEALTGTLSGAGKMYMPEWRKWNNPASWDATLSLAVTDGVAQRLPILVRLWSTLSLQGLLSLQLPSLPSEGLAFSSLTGDFALGKGLAVTHNLSLNSSAVRMDAHGEIDLARRTVDLKTALVPLHGITSSVAKVPLAGELLARGADLLTTLNFRVSGSYDDPSVTPLLVDTGK